MPHHEKHLKHGPKPHKRHLGRGLSLFIAIGISSILTALFLGLLTAIQIPLSVALPTSAPIWVGVSTLLQNQRR